MMGVAFFKQSINGLEHFCENTSPIKIAALFVVVSLLWLTFRNHGVYATVMWDEWEYSRFSRQLPRPMADVPYYLYYFVYGATRVCGNGFLGCAQFMNAIFLLGSAPLIYGVARLVTTRGTSLWIAGLSVLGGITVYTTHFVPEAMYFFGFWLITWWVLRALNKEVFGYRLGGVVGAALAILSLIKMHALFLLPGFAVFFVALYMMCVSIKTITGLAVAIASMVCAFLLVRMGLGYVLAGDSGLNFIGSAYATRAGEATHSASSIINVLLPALELIKAHGVALAAMFALPLFVVPCLKIESVGSNTTARVLKAYVVSLFVPLLFIVAAYSAHVRALDPIIEGSTYIRLHMRYYNFMFPLFAIMVAGISGETICKPWARYVVAIIVAAAALSFVVDIGHHELSVFDGPELRGFATIKPVFYALSTLSLIVLGRGAVAPKAAARIFLIIYLPLITIMGSAAATVSAMKEKTPNVFHRAGIYAKQKLGSGVEHLAIVAPDYAGVYHAMFYTDNPNVGYHMRTPEDSCFSLTPKANGKTWYMFIGNYKNLGAFKDADQQDGFVLAKANPSDLVVTPCP